MITLKTMKVRLDVASKHHKEPPRFFKILFGQMNPRLTYSTVEWAHSGTWSLMFIDCEIVDRSSRMLFI